MYTRRPSTTVYRPSLASSISEPVCSVASARSSSSAPLTVTVAPRIWPPSKHSSTRTESGSLNGHHLCEDAVDGIGMDECDLKAEEALPGLRVDQLGAGGGEPVELSADVLDLVGNVVHARAVLGEEFPHRRFLPERCEQLHPP